MRAVPGKTQAALRGAIGDFPCATFIPMRTV